MVPEDSMLRRHYLTELKSNQDKQFQRFLAETGDRPLPEVNIDPEPVWSLTVLLPLVMFAFFLGVLFL